MQSYETNNSTLTKQEHDRYISIWCDKMLSGDIKWKVPITKAKQAHRSFIRKWLKFLVKIKWTLNIPL